MGELSLYVVLLTRLYFNLYRLTKDTFNGDGRYRYVVFSERKADSDAPTKCLLIGLCKLALAKKSLGIRIVGLGVFFL